MRPTLTRTGLSLLGLGGVAAYDLIQRKHALLRNFPVVGHGRYLLERIGPELRQYIVAGNDEERPFSRDQRAWIYASSKLENNYRGFGTDNDIEYTEGYPVIKQRTLAHAGQEAWLPGAKVMGAAPPAGRRPHCPDRHRLLRLSRAAGRLIHLDQRYSTSGRPAPA